MSELPDWAGRLQAIVVPVVPDDAVTVTELCNAWGIGRNTVERRLRERIESGELQRAMRNGIYYYWPANGDAP